MLTQHLKKTKQHFIALAALLALVIAIGSLSFERTNFLTRGVENISFHMKTALYRAQYYRNEGAASAAAFGAPIPLEQEGTARAIPVLLYHGIVSHADRFSMTSDTFREQLFALKRAGYHTVSLKEAKEFLEGKTTLEPGAMLITFDDGRTDSYKGADPILSAVGFSAVMFVATQDSLTPADSSGDRYYIDASTIKKMGGSGRWEIGSHAIQETGGYVPIDAAGMKGNFLSNKQWLMSQQRLETIDEYQARLNRELSLSRENLEDLLGVSVEAFSYPFSDFGQQQSNNPLSPEFVNKVVASHYALAFQQVWPTSSESTFNFPEDDMIHLRRIEVPTDWSGEMLVSFLQTAAPKQLPFSDRFTDAGVWKNTWGKVDLLANGGATLSSTKGTTGAEIFLDGSKDWTNYRFTTIAALKEGSHLTLMARYLDGNNYIGCVFGDGKVRLEEVIDGNKTVFENEALKKSLDNEVHSLGIGVDGGKGRCHLDGQPATILYTLRQGLSHGGIGVKIWDQTPGTSVLEIRSAQAISLDTPRVLP